MKKTELEKRYNKLKKDIEIKRENGKFREKFDELYDDFFLDDRLRKKYGAWNDEDLPCKYSNSELEEILEEKDIEHFCDFFEVWVDRFWKDVNWDWKKN